MDISDQHIQQLAAGTHGASHGFLPLSYMHNLQTADNYSTHPPIYTIIQPPLIINSNELSSINKGPPAALIHCNTHAAAADSTMSPSYFMFTPGLNMSMGSINSGFNQISGSYKTAFELNQIYNDPAHVFNIAGVDPDLNHDRKPPADPNSATNPSRSSGTSTVLTSQAVSQSGCEDAPCDADSTHNTVKLEPGMDHYAPPSSFTSSGYPSASHAAASFLDSLHNMDMESLKEEAYIDQRIGTFDHDTVASTSSPADQHHHHHHHHHSHFFDFCNLPPSISARDKDPSSIGSHGYSLHGLIIENNTTSPNNKPSCGHASAAENAIKTATSRCKAQAPPKRRKSQQKRVVCVPATGGLDRPTGECLPSDSWAWRKYGQKPIKNSKYPRSYYKCSSVKGCTARKQVERNPSNPMMIMITYIVDHSHPSIDQQHAAKTNEEDEADKQRNNESDKQINGNMISGDGNDTISEESCEPISSEGNYPEENLIIESAHHEVDDQYAAGAAAEQFARDQSDDYACDQQGVPSIVKGNIDNAYINNNNEGIHLVGLLSSSSSNYFGNLKKSSSDQRNKAEEDFFNQLDELPGLFGRNPGWPSDANQGSINVNPCNPDFFELYDWS